MSGKLMAAVDALFLLSMLLPKRGIIYVACGAWIGYLIYQLKRTPYRAVKIINGGLIVLAAIMMAANLYFMFRQRGGV